MRPAATDLRIVVQRAAGGFLAAAGLAAAAAWALRRNEIRFVVYEALPWPSGPWLAVSLLAFGAALAFPLPRVRRKVLVILGCAGGAAAVLWLMAAPLTGAGRGSEDASYPAPGAATYRLVVHEGGVFDPIFFLSIEQQRGLLSRSWYVGCLDGDDDWIEEAGWGSPEMFWARTTGEEETIQIHVDPTSGRPVEPGIPTPCEYRP